jgi:hypothetical protein
MMRVLNGDLKKEGTAQHALRGSPPKIRAAENRLVADVEHVKNSVLHASKVTQLLSAFASLGHNPHMAVDGVTLANWYHAQCDQHAPATYPSVPSTPSTANTPSPPSTPSSPNGTP